MRKIAILDLGTNTFHLLIAGINGDTEVAVLDRMQIAVKLGENGFTGNKISELAIARAISGIQELKEKLDKQKVDKLVIYGTSAFRTSKNARKLVSFIESTLNENVQIIEGKKEAELIYYGVSRAVEFTKEPYLILDIGGGSIELIVANNEGIKYLRSIETGAARLMDKFHQNDPVKEEEIRKMRTFLKKKLNPVLQEIRNYEPAIMIGAAGSFETLAEIDLRHFENKDIKELPKVHKMTKERIDAISDKIISATKDELFQIKGMAAFRVSMIVVAVLLIRFIMEELAIKEVWFSDYAIKEGALWEEIDKLQDLQD